MGTSYYCKLEQGILFATYQMLKGSSFYTLLIIIYIYVCWQTKYLLACHMKPGSRCKLSGVCTYTIHYVYLDHGMWLASSKQQHEKVHSQLTVETTAPLNHRRHTLDFPNKVRSPRPPHIHARLTPNKHSVKITCCTWEGLHTHFVQTTQFFHRGLRF